MAGFISNTIFWFGIGVFVTAAMVNGLADTLAVAFPPLRVPAYRAALFAALLASIAYVNVCVAKQGMLLVKTITLVKMLPLLVRCGFGLWAGRAENLLWDRVPSPGDQGPVSLIIFFAFGGVETALNISDEVKNPARAAPRGILFGTLATVVAFCAIQLVAHAVLGAELMDHNDAPLGNREAQARTAGRRRHAPSWCLAA